MKIIVVGGVVIAFLVVIIFFLFNTDSAKSTLESAEKNPSGDTVAMISLLEKRLERFEIALAEISGKISTPQTSPAIAGTDMAIFVGRLDRVENAMSTKFNIISENMDKLDVQMADVVSRVKDLEKNISGKSPARKISQAGTFSGKTIQKSAGTATVSTVNTAIKSSTPQGSVKNKKTAMKKTTPKVVKKATSLRVYHVIKKGETFYSISKQYGTTVTHLQKLNNFSQQPTLYPGDKLIVK